MVRAGGFLSFYAVANMLAQAIDQALRSHCGISGKQYFVAVMLEDGTPTTFFSPGQKVNDTVVHQFFNPKKFQEVASHLDTGQFPT